MARAGLPSPRRCCPGDPTIQAPVLTGPVLALGDSVYLGAKAVPGRHRRPHRARENRTMKRGRSPHREARRCRESATTRRGGARDERPFGFKALDRIMRAGWARPVRLLGDDRVAGGGQVRLRGQGEPAIASDAGRWPNAHVIDWNASVLTAGLYPDGIHLNPVGCQAA